jgi:hypothetical protein
VDHFSTSWGRRPNKQSKAKRGCPFFLLLLLPQGERDSPRCNHSSEDKSILLPPIYGTTRGPQLVWLLCLLPQVEPHFAPPYMDGWQVLGLGFNSHCTTLYGWMTSFWVGFQLTLYYFIRMDDKFLGWVSTHFVPPYMDGWQVFGLGFNSLCTTLYGWMTSFWVGLIVCKGGNLTLYPSSLLSLSFALGFARQVDYNKSNTYGMEPY